MAGEAAASWSPAKAEGNSPNRSDGYTYGIVHVCIGT